MSLAADVFAVPVHGKHLLIAPLHGMLALVNKSAMRQLKQGLANGRPPAAPVLEQLWSRLGAPAAQPAARLGPVTSPLFLGIIPTRGCNMGCTYCDFAAPKRTSPTMSLELARAAVDAYFHLLPSDCCRAAIHFFGGEPFFAAPVIHFVITYATARAAARGISLHFEVTTNGLYGARQCRWIADQFDTVVLSLDGIAAEHNRQRPTVNGRATFTTVARSAQILSDGPTELVLRACITQDSVAKMAAFAHWITQNLRPKAVCFETLVPSALAATANLHAPDPWLFAQQFDRAASILNAAGIEAVLSTADTTSCHLSFCPVGQDALIVSPDGVVNACYLLPEQWQARQLDLRLGSLQTHPPRYLLDEIAVQRIRQINVNQKSQCADCFCRYHCAGGCHVNHKATAAPGTFDDACIQTRLVTVSRLLRQLGQDDLATAWLADHQEMETAVFQPTDRLLHQDVS